jgi:K+-transporting ATPase ATPase C chain
MNNLASYFRASLGLLLIFVILLGGIYPLAVTAISQLIFNSAADGSLIKDGDKVIGSSLLGQQFTGDKYFWGRLSAEGYDAMRSGGTNLSPANPKALEAAKARVEALKKADPDNKALVPVDLVTASASGLDPHISLLAAEYQIGRVAKARGMNPDDVQQMINDHIDSQSKLFGEPYVNVLELNIALDKK